MTNEENAGAFTVWIAGPPVAYSRTLNNKNGSRFYAEPYKSWRKAAASIIAAKHGRAEPFNRPCDILVESFWPITPGWPLWKQDAAGRGIIEPTGKPDGDNLLKAACDVLSGKVLKGKRNAGLGRVVIDDAVIVDKRVVKRYCQNRAFIPGLRITVRQRYTVCSSVKSKRELRSLIAEI